MAKQMMGRAALWAAAVGVAAGLVAVPALHAGGAVTPSPVSGKQVAVPRATLKARVRVTTPAQRAADPQRRPLLQAARRAGTAVPIGVMRDAYLKQARAQWQQLDANGDGTLSWQAGKEGLGSKISQCVVVAYQQVAASKEKDKSHPGKYVETPAHWQPTDWLSWPELLAATTVNGQCETLGYTETAQCLDKAGQPLKLSYKPLDTLASCTGALGLPTTCTRTPKQLCESQGGVYQVNTKLDHCETYEQLGPATEAAFVEVARQNFDSEDHDHNGVIGAGEGEYLCLK